MKQKIFTLTAGRSGSGWLSKFVEANLDITTVHEPLEIDDFDTKMPSIKVLRSFNTRGMDSVVREFWQRKLQTLPENALYCETNHTLGKCGLIETLAEQPNADEYTVIVLKRNLAKQCASYINRKDFINVLMLWQWYLSPDYPNIMVSAEALRPLGASGLAVWYTLEMECRQRYYQRVYADRLRFVEVQLEEAVTVDGATRLLSDLGYDQQPILPPKYNASTQSSDDQMVAKIGAIISDSGFDPDQIVTDYLNANLNLAMEHTRLAS